MVAHTSLKKQIVLDQTSNIHISSLDDNLDLGQKVSLIEIEKKTYQRINNDDQK